LEGRLDCLKKGQGKPVFKKTRRNGMKKIIGIMAVGLLLFGFAGQSMAGFTDGWLIRVIYDTSTNQEAAYALGQFTNSAGASYLNFSALTSTPTTIGANMNLADVGASDWSEVNVAYIAVQRPTSATQGAYIAGTQPLSTGGSAWASFSGAVAANETFYGGTSKILATGKSTGNASSYFFKEDSSGTNVGGMAGFIVPGMVGAEMNMGSPTLMQLYYWNATVDNIPGAGVDLAGLVTVMNGTSAFTQIQAGAAPVPVPPSVLLLAPGLFALIGIRRRQA
jgi:hypothetical protein